MFAIRHEQPADAGAVETLLDRCFGVDRRHKASYRFRDGVPPLSEHCFVAADETGRLVGAIRYWPIRLDQQPALLLGPLAIDPDRQGRGIGRALVFHSLETATAAGHRLVFLVGDPTYYARFGFSVAPPGIVMPDEPHGRLHVRRLDAGLRLPRRGTLRPVPATPAAALSHPTMSRACAPVAKAIATVAAIT